MQNIYSPVYLGDSVYAKFDGYGVELYLDNGLGGHSRIYLEPEVLDSFNTYRENLEKMIREFKEESD